MNRRGLQLLLQLDYCYGWIVSAAMGNPVALALVGAGDPNALIHDVSREYSRLSDSRSLRREALKLRRQARPR